MRTPYADIQNQPMQPAGANVAQLVQLPGTGDSKLTGTKIEFLTAGDHRDGAGFQKHDFHAFVAMEVFIPILGMLGIPEANAAQTREQVARLRTEAKKSGAEK